MVKMMDQINRDIDQGEPDNVKLIFLGDLIDRGKSSKVLLDSFFRLRNKNIIVLKGNHEAALVDSYRGNDAAFRFWLEFGGIATLLSYDIDAATDEVPDLAKLRDEMHRKFDPELIDWLDALPLSYSEGDYFFVHAGIRPGRELAKQLEEDMLWIREPFLNSTDDHGKVIVHGHTVSDEDVVLGGTRIGLDTGAHENGRLTALGLQDSLQWTVCVETSYRDQTGTLAQKTG